MSSDDLEKPRWMDWLARVMAWGTIKVPRVAPSRWSQESNRREANDLTSERFEIITDDGVKLDGWHFPVKSSGNSQPPREPVFFSHGWTETKEFHVRLARVLLAAGHPVILFDQRGHGKSGGCCTLGVREPSDLRAVIDAATQRGWAGDRVLTMGVSMGGASVLRHAAADPRVVGVVAYAPFTSFLDAIRSYGRRYVPFLSADWGVRGFVQSSLRRGFDIREADAMSAIKNIRVPLLFIVGQSDINLPASDHASILLGATTPGQARLIEVPQATHFNIVMRQWPGVDDEVLAFLRKAGELQAERQHQRPPNEPDSLSRSGDQRL